MSEKCFVALTTGQKTIVRAAKFHVSKRIITCRVRWRENITIEVAGGVEPLFNYKKGKGLWIVDFSRLVALPIGDVVIEDKNVKEKLDLISQSAFWRALGGRAIGLVETLILLAAGYGCLRLVEFLIGRM